MNKHLTQKILRYFVLLIVVLISGYLVYRSENSNSCQQESICNKCSKVSTCSLPAAKDFKETQKK